MGFFQSILKLLGIYCWFHGHEYLGHTDNNHRLCSNCPRLQVKVSGSWITYKKQKLWDRKTKKKES